MPSFQYIGHRPEHIVGIPAGDISEAEYDALSWDLQQAVLINKGSNGGPLYVERATTTEKREATRVMNAATDDDEAPAQAAVPATSADERTT